MLQEGGLGQRGGLNHPKGLFWSTKTTRGSLEKYYFFIEKSTFEKKSTIFKKIFQNFLTKNFFLPKKYFLKNFCKKFFFQKNFFFKKNFQNFSKISKIFENCRIKMQKKSIFRENWWVTKNTWGHFSPHQNHLEGKIGKGPPTTSLNSKYGHFEWSILRGMVPDFRPAMYHKMQPIWYGSNMESDPWAPNPSIPNGHIWS